MKLLRFLLGSILLGQVWAGEATLHEEAGELLFANAHLMLRFDRETGIWTGLETPAGSVFFRRPAAEPAANLRVAGKPVFAPGTPFLRRRHELVQLPVATRFEVVVAQGDWEATLGYTLWDAGTLQRTVVFAYLGNETGGEVRQASLLLPPLAVPGEDAHWFATAEYPARDHAFRHASPGRSYPYPFSSSIIGGLVARSEASGESLVAAYYCEDEWIRPDFREEQEAVRVEYNQLLAEWLRPGLRVDAGSQLVRVLRGTRQDALQALQDFFELPGLRTRIGMPADTGRNVFYSAHPGGTIDANFRDVGGFANFAKLLPGLREMGVNVLWLLPFWYGPVYAPYDYYRLDPRCGTPEELRALTDRAHGLGMRVLGDLIPHGPREEPGVKPTFGETYPEWICRDQEGNMLFWWGCYYTDYAHPGWQDYMAEHAAYWVREGGLDGYRVDVAAGGAPNWRPHGSNRPSFSGLRGGLELMRKARAACLRENPNTLFLAETQGAVLYSAAEHEYDWAFARLLRDHVLADDPAAFVQGMSGYLENHTHAFPADAFPIRFLTNHDELRARYLYGPGLHRALLALCAFMKGAPLLYHEQEIGNEDFLAKLYGIRARYDELSVGKVSYRRVRATPAHVFCIEREHQGKRSVAVINLVNEPATVRLSLPAEGLARPGIHEAASGVNLAYAPVTEYDLSAYGYAVFVIREQDELPPAVPAPVHPRMERSSETRITRTGDTAALAHPGFAATVEATRGGLLGELRGPDGIPLLRGMELREGQRKLFVGCDPLDLAATQATLEVSDTEAVATGELRDSAGVPRLAYRLHYRLTEAGLDGEVALSPLTELPPTKSELNLWLRFATASHWFAQTTEGDLQGRARRIWATAQGFDGRYWHGAGEAFHDTSLYPLPPGGSLGVLDETRRLALALSLLPGGDFAERVRLVEDKATDPPGELGGPAAVTAEIRLIEKDQTTVWEKGREKRCRFRLAVGPAETVFKREAGAAAQWHTFGSRYILSGPNLRAEVVRSRGGGLAALVDGNGQGLRVSDARFYTDQGLYGEWADSRGVLNKMNATNRDDPEPDTRLLPGSPLELRFRSFFRHPYAGGRSLLNPRIEYAVDYTMPVAEGQGLRIDCGVRPYLTKFATGGFLAYKITLDGPDQWQLDGGEWQGLPETSQRVWQSKAAGHLPQTLALRDSKTGAWTRFANFAAGEDQVQNVFIHAGKGQVHFFVAFYDMEPTDIRPLWRRAAFTIQAGGDQ